MKFHITLILGAVLAITGLGVLEPVSAQSGLDRDNGAAIKQLPNNFAMLDLNATTASTTDAETGIVEQLQQIQQASVQPDGISLPRLVNMLDSQYALARRKAAFVLLDKARAASLDNKQYLSQLLEKKLIQPTPVDNTMQRAIVQTYAALNIPQANETMRRFFQFSPHQAQLIAVEALLKDVNMDRNELNAARQLSPYADVRQAAAERKP